jgi:glycine cleavage system H protein
MIRMSPEQLRFAKTHEWVRVETAGGDKIAVVGISDFAIKALTDLVFIDLPEPGRTVAAGEGFAEVESVKAVSDIYSPVAGEIVEVNSSIAQQLDALATDPYGAGWLIKIKIADEGGLGHLMDYAAYEKQCAEEGT